MWDSLCRAYSDIELYYNNDLQIKKTYEYIKKIKENDEIAEKSYKIIKKINLNDISIYLLNKKFDYFLHTLINNYHLINYRYPLLLDLFFLIFSFIAIFLFFIEKISYNKQVIVFLFYGALLCIKIGYYLSFLLSFAEV